MSSSQYYVFRAEGWAWCEVFDGDLHVTVPTPFRAVSDALELLTARFPGATVDELVHAEDVQDALRFATI